MFLKYQNQTNGDGIKDVDLRECLGEVHGTTCSHSLCDITAVLCTPACRGMKLIKVIHAGWVARRVDVRTLIIYYTWLV